LDASIIFLNSNFQIMTDKKERVFIAFPPKRHNSSMALVSKGSMIIGRKKLFDAQFDEEVMSKTGYKLKRPTEWK
jgi:hypothetical protein